MKRIRGVCVAILLALTLIPSGLATPSASAAFDVYTTPGEHTINGRQWRTWCEKYSQTVRCRTEIWGTTTVLSGGVYRSQNGWSFNNLTYVSSPTGLWTGNPIATPGSHTINGRQWQTECYTPRTGNGCRSYLWADVVVAAKKSSGWTFSVQRKLVLNNIVQFGPLRTDLDELVTWRPKASYTRSEIDYFASIALGSEYGEASETVRKYLHDVDVQIHGAPTLKDRETTAAVVADLNRLIPSVDVRLVNKNGDINIYFVPQEEAVDYVPGYVDYNLGFFTFYNKPSGELVGADIFVSTDWTTQALRSHLVREELTQSFGLAKDSDEYPDSIFFQSYSEVQKYSPMDEAIIELLYLPEIKVGFTKKQVESAVEVRGG
ncbi:MAG: DUF2927 domain-containing protein [Arachnia sp.]